MKNFKTSRSLAAALASLTVTAGALAAPVNVAVTVHASGAANVIRDKIGRSTFGSGVEHQTPQFRTLTQYPVATPSAAQAAMKNLGLGMLRFSHGTPGQWYYWDIPKKSYFEAKITADMILTQQEILDATAVDRLDMDRVFQVNTAQYENSSGYHSYVHVAGTVPKRINPTGLDDAAKSAARWVAENSGRLQSERVTYWEVGNEDWHYWSAGDYAKIFNAFAGRMKQANSSIKLLAQSLTNEWIGEGGIKRDKSWLQGLLDGGIDTAYVHALSDHQYMSGLEYSSGTYDDQRVWQTQDLFAWLKEEWRVKFLRDTLKAKQLPWEIWVTEFNVWPKGPDGTSVNWTQDLGHALVIADWVGMMLKHGADKLFMHSLDHHPHFALVQYANWGGTPDNPYVNAPAHVFSKYAKSFGEKMVTHDEAGNATLYSTKAGPYQQVGVYPSVRESDVAVYGGAPSLRVVVINRSMTDVANVTIHTSNRPIAGAPKKYWVDVLTADTISASNKVDHHKVEWKTAVNGAQSSSAGITHQLPAKSVAFFTIPLQ